MNSQVLVLLNDGKGGFSTQSPNSLTLTLDGVPAALTTADVDGDGRADLIVPMKAAGAVSVYLSRKLAQSMSIKLNPPAGCGPQSAGAGDINSDGRPDLVVGCQASAMVLIFLQNADGTFAKLPSHSDPIPAGIGNLAFIVVADVDLNGKPDVVMAGSRGLGVLRNDSY